MSAAFLGALALSALRGLEGKVESAPCCLPGHGHRSECGSHRTGVGNKRSFSLDFLYSLFSDSICPFFPSIKPQISEHEEETLSEGSSHGENQPSGDPWCLRGHPRLGFTPALPLPPGESLTLKPAALQQLAGLIRTRCLQDSAILYMNLRKQAVEAFPRKTGVQTTPVVCRCQAVYMTALEPSCTFSISSE